jgi:hypothetical protein
MATDHRSNASARVENLIALLRGVPEHKQLEPIVAECESLSRAITAFHMEGIRFRMYNVDRLLAKGGLPIPSEAPGIFADLRRDLEAAGFHTRSHQAPPTASSSSTS